MEPEARYFLASSCVLLCVLCVAWILSGTGSEIFSGFKLRVLCVLCVLWRDKWNGKRDIFYVSGLSKLESGSTRRNTWVTGWFFNTLRTQELQIPIKLSVHPVFPLEQARKTQLMLTQCCNCAPHTSTRTHTHLARKTQEAHAVLQLRRTHKHTHMHTHTHTHTPDSQRRSINHSFSITPLSRRFPFHTDRQ